MNKKRAKELLPVYEAFITGKIIQVYIDNDEGWSDITEDIIGWCDSLKYRIKPEPRKFWVKPFAPHDFDHSESHSCKDTGCIYVCEVLPGDE